MTNAIIAHLRKNSAKDNGPSARARHETPPLVLPTGLVGGYSGVTGVSGSKSHTGTVGRALATELCKRNSRRGSNSSLRPRRRLSLTAQLPVEMMESYERLNKKSFLDDLRDMLEHVETTEDHNIVSWGPRGLTFIIRNKPLFGAKIATKYFDISSHSSFRMILQSWGFVVDLDAASGYEVYHHPNFTRDNPKSCQNLTPAQMTQLPLQQASLTDALLMLKENNTSTAAISNRIAAAAASSAAASNNIAASNAEDPASGRSSPQSTEDKKEPEKIPIITKKVPQSKIKIPLVSDSAMSPSSTKAPAAAAAATRRISSPPSSKPAKAPSPTLGSQKSSIKDFLSQRQNRRLSTGNMPLTSSTNVALSSATAPASGNSATVEMLKLKGSFRRHNSTNTTGASALVASQAIPGTNSAISALLSQDLLVAQILRENQSKLTSGIVSANLSAAAQPSIAGIAGVGPNTGGVRTSKSRNFTDDLRLILDDAEKLGFDHIVSWMPHGRSFKVHKEKEFVQKILLKYTNKTAIASFQGALQRFGFTHIQRGPEVGAYFHPFFIRQLPLLCQGKTSLQMKSGGWKKDTTPDFFLAGGKLKPSKLQNDTATPVTPVPPEAEA